MSSTLANAPLTVQVKDVQTFYETLTVKGALASVDDIQWEVEYLGVGEDADYVRIVDAVKGFYVLVWRAGIDDFGQPAQKLTFSSKPMKRMTQALWAGYQFLMQN